MFNNQNNPNMQQPIQGPLDQNAMNQIAQAASNLNQQLSQMGKTPQQYLQEQMNSGAVTQDAYNRARQMANFIMGVNY